MTLEPLQKEYEKIYDKLEKIAVKLGNSYIDDLPTRPAKQSQLENIFNPAFLTRVIYKLDTTVSHPLTFDEIKDNPWVCNFPSALTSRQKNYRGNGSAPCTRRLGLNKSNPNVYFCSVPRHLAYAKTLGLPVDVNDLRCKGLPIPMKPEGSISNRTHIRTKLTVDGKLVDIQRPERQGSAINPEQSRVQFKSTKRKKTKIEDIGDLDTVEQKEDNDDLVELPRFQCVYICPFTGISCEDQGVNCDPVEKEIYFCDKHIVSPADLIDQLEDEHDLDENVQNLLSELYSLEKLDYEIDEIVGMDKVDNIEDLKDLKDFEKLSILGHKRYNLASKLGIGSTDIVRNIITKRLMEGRSSV